MDTMHTQFFKSDSEGTKLFIRLHSDMHVTH